MIRKTIAEGIIVKFIVKFVNIGGNVNKEVISAPSCRRFRAVSRVGIYPNRASLICKFKEIINFFGHVILRDIADLGFWSFPPYFSSVKGMK